MPARLLLVAAILLLVESRTAQIPIAPRDRPADRSQRTGTAAIRGRVVDGHTGAAVVHAHVRLTGIGEPRATVTNEAGVFAFMALPRGSYWVFVEKATYVPARYPETAQSMRSAARSIVLGEGEALENLVIPLFHGGVIAGRVVDALGDPVEMAAVQALRLPKSVRMRPQSRGFSRTNDLGEFRIAHLEPARYLVVVMPQNDQYVHVAAGNVSDGPEAQLAPTFYPGVPSLAEAQPITIERGGSATGVDITVVETGTATVTGIVEDVNGEPLSRGAGLTARPIIQELSRYMFGGASANVKPDGTFRLRLTPGEYELEVQVAGTPNDYAARSAKTELFGLARVTVNGDISGVTIQLGSGARASGRIVFDGTRAVPTISSGPPYVQLVTQASDDTPCRQGRIDLAPDFTFTVDGLFGTCIVSVNGQTDRSCVCRDRRAWSADARLRRCAVRRRQIEMDRPVAVREAIGVRHDQRSAGRRVFRRCGGRHRSRSHP
jgi:Carboxypeptidase regulatory-like domain